MKLGAIPSILLTIICVYIAIPTESNVIFMFIDTVTASFCSGAPDVIGVCDIIPMLKIMMSIIGAIGAIMTLFHVIGMLFRGELFSANNKE